MKMYPIHRAARPNKLGMWLAQFIPTLEVWGASVHLGLVQNMPAPGVDWHPVMRHPFLSIRRDGVRVVK